MCSMRENRMMPIGRNTFYLTAEVGKDDTICGTVQSFALNRKAEFTRLSRLVVLLEEWMDTAGDEVPAKPVLKAELADFELGILFRQNYSWQGRLRCIEAGTEATFRSVLELLIQLETMFAR